MVRQGTEYFNFKFWVKFTAWTTSSLTQTEKNVKKYDPFRDKCYDMHEFP